MKKAILVAGILVMTSLITIANENAKENKLFNFDNAVKIEPNIVKLSPTTVNQGNVLITADSPEEDILPFMTIDPAGNIVVTWSHLVSAIEGGFGFAYSADGSTWNGYLVMPEGIAWYSSFGKVVAPEFSGLYGVYLRASAEGETSGFYLIPDITDDTTWEIYYWVPGDESDFLYTYVDDNCIYENKDYGRSFTAMKVFHERYGGYDIAACPILEYVFTDISGGVFYFDAQSRLATAPASYPAMANVENYMHLVWSYYDGEHYKLVYKKIDPLVEPDIEYTEWQFYLDEGDYDCRYADADGVGSEVYIVYCTNENGNWDIFMQYSNDDGNTWTKTQITSGEDDELYPAIYVSGSTIYLAYVSNGNVYFMKSEDKGATWEEPVQINEVDGTVSMEEHAVDICSRGIVWVDTRNGNKDIYYSTFPAPIISIEKISGGFGVKATIANIGTLPAENVNWKVEISGMVFIGKSTEGTIDVLNPGESKDVGPGFVFGIGPVTITVTADGVSKTAEGFMLGPLVLGVS